MGSNGNEVSIDSDRLFSWCDRDHGGKKKKKHIFLFDFLVVL